MIKINQMEILELKHSITEMKKKSLGKINQNVKRQKKESIKLKEDYRAHNLKISREKNKGN